MIHWSITKCVYFVAHTICVCFCGLFIFKRACYAAKNISWSVAVDKKEWVDGLRWLSVNQVVDLHFKLQEEIKKALQAARYW